MRQITSWFAILLLLMPVSLSDTSLNTSYNLSNGEHDYSHINLKLMNKTSFNTESDLFTLLQYDYAKSDHEVLKNNLKAEINYNKCFKNYKQLSWSFDNSYYNYIAHTQYRSGIGLIYKYNDILLIGFIPSYDFEYSEIAMKIYEHFRLYIFDECEIYHKAEIVKGKTNKTISVDNGINLFVSDSLSIGLNANYEYNDSVQNDELSILVTTNLKL